MMIHDVKRVSFDQPPPVPTNRLILRTNHPGSYPQQEPTEEVRVVDMIQQPPRRTNKAYFIMER